MNRKIGGVPDYVPVEQAMLNDDRPRTLWSEMIVLAEQLQPEPRLIPTDEDQRIEMFGLCHEICGDDGLVLDRGSFAVAK